MRIFVGSILLGFRTVMYFQTGYSLRLVMHVTPPLPRCCCCALCTCVLQTALEATVASGMPDAVIGSTTPLHTALRAQPTRSLLFSGRPTAAFATVPMTHAGTYFGIPGGNPVVAIPVTTSARKALQAIFVRGCFYPTSRKGYVLQNVPDFTV